MYKNVYFKVLQYEEYIIILLTKVLILTNTTIPIYKNYHSNSIKVQTSNTIFQFEIWQSPQNAWQCTLPYYGPTKTQKKY